MDNKSNISLSLTKFWQWAYSDLSYIISNPILAEYIVSSAVGTISTRYNRTICHPYKIITKHGYLVDVKSAAYVQSYDAEHPEQISFLLASTVDETGDFKSAPQSNSDLFIFCLYKALSMDQSPFDINLWDFYIISTKVLNEKIPNRKSITLSRLKTLEPILCDYYGIGEAITKTMSA